MSAENLIWMKNFELFCLIYYALDSIWDDNHDGTLGDFLSAMNPFLFEEIGSADPAIFAKFEKAISDEISIENSYEIALDYLRVENSFLSLYFEKVSKKNWIKCATDYLSFPHKN